MSWTKKIQRLLNPNTNMKIKTTWATILAFLALDSSKETTLTEEHVDKLESELVRLQSANKKAGEELTSANKSIDTLKAENSDLIKKNEDASASLKNLETENAELRKNAGAPPAKAKTDKETVVEETETLVVRDDASFEENLAAMKKAYSIK